MIDNKPDKCNKQAHVPTYFSTRLFSSILLSRGSHKHNRLLARFQVYSKPLHIAFGAPLSCHDACSCRTQCAVLLCQVSRSTLTFSRAALLQLAGHRLESPPLLPQPHRCHVGRSTRSTRPSSFAYLDGALLPTWRAFALDLPARGRSGIAVPTRCRGRTPSRCGCRCRERGGGDKPDVCKTLAVCLTRSGVARIGIQGMAIIRDLAAVGIVHQAKSSRKRGRDAWQRGTQDRGPCTGAATPADGGSGVRAAIVKLHRLRIL